MGRSVLVVLVMGALLALPVAAGADAALTTWRAAGTVLAASDDPDCASVAAGDAFVVEYSFDPATPDTTPDSSAGVYELSAGTLTVGPVSAAFPDGGIIFVLPGFGRSQPSWFTVASSTGSADLGFALVDSSGSSLQGRSLPATPPDPALFDTQALGYAPGCSVPVTVESHVVVSLDADGDGVPDADDVCPDTDLVADVAPVEQKRNRLWSDAEGRFLFGDGDDSGITVADTGGCSASQVIDALGLGAGHVRFGVTQSAMAAYLAA